MNEFKQKRIWPAGKDALYLSIFWVFAISLMLTSGAVNSAGGAGGAGNGSYAVPATYQQPVYGAHQETVEDMRVKVMGGYVVMTRNWDRGEWYINGRWQALQTAGCRVDASIPCAIFRGGTRYERIAQTNVYQHEKNPRETITQTDTGYRWQDRDGNWIIYTGNRLTSYGDRNNVTVRLQYDDSEKLTGVFDHFNNQIIWYEYNAANRVSAIRDYSERRVEYQYDSQGRFTTVTDVRGNTLSYTYAGVNLSTKTDQEGRVATISYGANGVVTSILDQDDIGDTYSYGFNKNKKEFYKKLKSTSGRIIEEWFNRDGEVVRNDVGGITERTVAYDGNNKTIYNMAGGITRLIRDQWENNIKVILPDNSTVTANYNSANSNVLRETNANGISVQYEYNESGNLIRKIEAAGLPEQRITTYTVDVYGNRLTRMIHADEVSDAVIERGTYDAYGNRITRTDGEGNVWRYTYDVLGGILTITDPLDRVWTYTYDVAGNSLSDKSPLDNVISYTYDGVGNIVSKIDARNNSTVYFYDNRNNLISVTDAHGNTLLNTYDHDNLLVKVTDREGRVKKYTYDGLKRLSTITDGENNLTAFSYVAPLTNGAGGIEKITWPTSGQEFFYDNRNRVTSEAIKPSADTSYVKTFTYDKVNNLLTYVDENSHTTSYVYDALNRRIKMSNALSQTVSLFYDNRDNLISVIDPISVVTSYTYNARNQLTSEKILTDAYKTFFYNAAGDQIRKLSGEGVREDYIFDADRRLTTINYFNSSEAITASKAVSFTLDPSNNITSYRDGSISGTLTYDELDRLMSESVNFGPFTKSYAYSYYPNGLKASFTPPNSPAISYTYNSNNQLLSATIPQQGTLTVGDYFWDKAQKITYPGGVTREYTYNSLRRKTGILVKDPAENIVMNYTYSYDAKGNVLTKSTEHGDYEYAYDNADRLLSASSPVFGAQNFVYDPSGNRVSDNQLLGAWQYNNDGFLTGIGTENDFIYNKDGHVVSKTQFGQIQSYGYNLEGRLTQVNEGAITLGTYSYDPFGRRIKKTTTGEGVKYFLYANEGLIAEYDESGSEVRAYGYFPDESWTANVIYLRTSGQYYYSQNDIIGTPQKVLSGSGSTVWSAKYKAFGETQIDTAVVNNPLRFAGQYADLESGLYQNHFRDYNPKLGRYMQYDPIGLAGGINPYVYVGNNPLVYVDPEGRLAWFVVPAITGAISAACSAANGGSAGDVAAAAGIGAIPGGWGVAAGVAYGAATDGGCGALANAGSGAAGYVVGSQVTNAQARRALARRHMPGPVSGGRQIGGGVAGAVAGCGFSSLWGLAMQ